MLCAMILLICTVGTALSSWFCYQIGRAAGWREGWDTSCASHRAAENYNQAPRAPRRR